MGNTRGRPELEVGPLLRFVDESRATIWVETDRRCRVEVHTGDGVHGANTWSVHGHHYSLVRIEDLTPNTQHEYRVTLDGDEVWPAAGSPFPPSVIRTPDPDAPYRLAFGSCRLIMVGQALRWQDDAWRSCFPQGRGFPVAHAGQ